MKETTRDKRKKKLGFFGILLRVLGGILAVLLLTVLVLFVIPLTETGDRTAVIGSADWMAKLDDGLPLNEITLPGTHDSATQYVQLGFFSKCQGMSVGEQLEAGYRYLDVRLAVDGEGLKLMHGFTSCKFGPMPWSKPLSLDKVLEDCYVFLAEHPGETVIFAVKQEHGDESVAEFERMLNRYTRQEPSFWLLTDRLPRLGEARGKLVLLRRYEDEAQLGAEAGIPLLWENQSGFDRPELNSAAEDNISYTLWVQDRYEYGVEEKWAAFTAGMDPAHSEDGNVSLSFLSTKGNATYGHPHFFAARLNPRLAEKNGLSGWIVLDFGSAPLAERIYRNNF